MNEKELRETIYKQAVTILSEKGFITRKNIDDTADVVDKKPYYDPWRIFNRTQSVVKRLKKSKLVKYSSSRKEWVSTNRKLCEHCSGTGFSS